MGVCISYRILPNHDFVKHPLSYKSLKKNKTAFRYVSIRRFRPDPHPSLSYSYPLTTSTLPYAFPKPPFPIPPKLYPSPTPPYLPHPIPTRYPCPTPPSLYLLLHHYTNLPTPCLPAPDCYSLPTPPLHLLTQYHIFPRILGHSESTMAK